MCFIRTEGETWSRVLLWIYWSLFVVLQLTASVGGAQLSRSLSRRLGPSPQAKPPRSPEWLQATENVPPHGVGGKRDKRRRRRAPRASETQQEAARPVKEEEPRDEVVQKNSRMKRWRKQRKRHTAARSDPEEAPGSEDRNDNEWAIRQNVWVNFQQLKFILKQVISDRFSSGGGAKSISPPVNGLF